MSSNGPLILAVSLSPNPVYCGETLKITAEIQECTHSRLEQYTHTELNAYTHAQLANEPLE